MTDTYDARAIANEVLKLAKAYGVALTNPQVQKISYIFNCWSLGILGRNMISESALKTEYSAIYQSLYNSLTRYGSGPVQNLICYKDTLPHADYKGGEYDVPVPSPMSRGGVVTCEIEKDTQAYKLLNSVFSIYWHTPVPRVNYELSLTTKLFADGRFIDEAHIRTIYSDIVTKIKTGNFIEDASKIVSSDVYTRFIEQE